eukprot:2037677-Amphidinium_carterae.1
MTLSALWFCSTGLSRAVELGSKHLRALHWRRLQACQAAKYNSIAGAPPPRAREDSGSLVGVRLHVAPKGSPKLCHGSGSG